MRPPDSLVRIFPLRESEPPHLERGSPRAADQPGPEPDINPLIP